MLNTLHKVKTWVRLRDILDNRWIYVHRFLEITDVFDVLPCMKYDTCTIR